jgi:hypothetical protein
MHNNKYSWDSFLRFLQFITDKHLVNTNTAKNWGVAALKFQDLIVEGEDSDNLKNIDLNNLIERFNHKYSHALTGASLIVYASRIRAALKNFISYADNPATFKPTSSKGKGNAGMRDKRKAKTKIPSPSVAEQKSREDNLPLSDSLFISVPIPLRKNLMIKISGIPYDLTLKEAERISAIVRGYAVSEE